TSQPDHIIFTGDLNMPDATTSPTGTGPVRAQSDLAAESTPGTAPQAAPAPAIEATITELVRLIHDGQIPPDALTPERRQQCVSQLALEGFSNAEIAQLMRTSERTVRRERLAARRDEPVTPDPMLGDELLGEFQRLAHAGIQRLTRLARDPDAPP